MTTRPRASRKTNIHLEGLESREAPTVGIAAALQAALAQTHGLDPRAIHYQSVHMALPTASRPRRARFRRAALEAVGASHD